MCEMITSNGIEIVHPSKFIGMYGEHSSPLLEQHDSADTDGAGEEYKEFFSTNSQKNEAKIFSTVQELLEYLNPEEQKVLQGVRTF